MIAGIEHIGILAQDPAALAAWYVEALNFREIFRTDDASAIFVHGTQSGMIEFVAYPAGQPLPGKDRRMHLAIVVDDFGAALCQLQAAGVNFPEPPRDIFGHGKVQFFQDPEGNWLHLVYRPHTPWD